MGKHSSLQEGVIHYEKRHLSLKCHRQDLYENSSPMAHRTTLRNTIANVGAEGEGVTLDAERVRGVRRGRSATPGLVSLWDENRRLYMDNLRLWDCLTLIRGDPTMSCQSAIKLVFGLNDEDYLKMFPDTKQLMLLMFPGGVVYHTTTEEARTENARLKDENARLHAAVWVLRDNPSLQADSTVAAIFRLDEAQFLSKFHSDTPTHEAAPTNQANRAQYQNNNKEWKKHLKTSLHMENDPAMDIHLTNHPIKAGCFGHESCPKSSRRQRSQSVMPNTLPSKTGSVSIVQRQDFTSNWKPTTPLEDEHAADKIKTSTISHLDNECAILCWRQSCYFQPVDLYALDKAKVQGAHGHCRQSPNPSQLKRSANKKGRSREIRRSHTIFRGGNVIAERICKRPSHALPIKCVSFAEPLPSCQVESPEIIEPAHPKDKSILDENCDFRSDPSKDGQCIASVELAKNVGSYIPLTKNASSVNISPKQANINLKTRKESVYTVAATREPSKRCLRDTATSPVLDTRTCFLILGHSHRSSFSEHADVFKDDCTASISDIYLLNKSGNNDNTLTVLPTVLQNPAPVPRAKSRQTRPFSPKQRDLREARLKNMSAFERLKKELEPKRRIIPCSTNNASSKSFEPERARHTGREHKPRNIIPRDTNNASFRPIILFEIERASSGEREIKRSSTNTDTSLVGSSLFEAALASYTNIFPFQKHVEEFKETSEHQDNEQEEEEEKNPSFEEEITHQTRNSLDSTPVIYFSSKPTIVQERKHIPYSIQSYTTVKHFIIRQRRIMNGLPCVQTDQAVFTRNIATSARPAEQQMFNIKHRGQYQGDIGRPMHFSVNQSDHVVTADMQNQQIMMKYKEKFKFDNCEGSSQHLNYVTDTTKNNKKDTSCGTMAKLKELKKLGNFKYTKPLADMIKRNGYYQWKPYNKNVLSNKFFWAHRPEMHFKPWGPFVTFIPQKKDK